MFSRLKLIAGIVVTALIAFLGAMLKIRTSERDTAVTERDKVIEVNESNEKVNEVKREIQKARDDVDSKSNGDVFSELQQYNRDRKNQD